MNHTCFWKRFTAALIDGIILNTGFEIILGILDGAVGKVNLLNFDLGNYEIILGLVYFAALDSLPEQLSIGKKIVEITFNNLKNKSLFVQFTTQYINKFSSITLF